MTLHTETQDKWIPTSCNGCFNVCAIKALAKDGKVVAVQGDPDVESSRGKICGKSKARIAELYDPKRVTRPLKRTNPEKGIGIDPMWQEISWEEALDTVVEQLQKVRDDDPRKLMIADFDIHNFTMPMAFAEAFGTPNYTWSSIPCGNGLHTVFFLTLGGLNAEIDLNSCNYIMLWGSQLGHGSNNNCMEAIRSMADARRRGAKLVVVDPVCGHAAAKADEWVPILPGTDAALALGMSNVMMNQLECYDRNFLKSKTNAPYLVDENGRYLRDPDHNKPLILDDADGKTKAFDDPGLKEPSLDNTVKVDNNISGRPSFLLLKDHLKKNYSPERVEKITTVPAETVVRLATEFAEAACIGETIEIEGQILPKRPAALEFKRGITHHKNSFGSCFSLMVPNILIGNIDAVGGLQGTPPYGPMNVWGIEPSEDGMISSTLIDALGGGHGVGGCFYKPYPPAEHGPPDRLSLRSLMPASGFISMLQWLVLKDTEKVKLPYRPSMLINSRNNVIMSHHNPGELAKVLKGFEFIVGFSIKIDETQEFADIILPEAHDFERWWTLPANLPGGFQPPGRGKWYFQACQPVVDPPQGVRNWTEVLSDIAQRMGFGDRMNEELNALLSIGIMEETELKEGKVYSAKDLVDRSALMYSLMAGEEPSEDLFTERQPVLNLAEKTMEEAFPIPMSQVRVPIYMEHLLEVSDNIGPLTKELGLDWWDMSHYSALPDWRPCPAYEDQDSQFDMFLHNGKVPLGTHTISTNNPWIIDVSSRNRMDFNLVINRATGNAKGIQDGDRVVVESKTGKVKGIARLSEAVHPKVVASFAQAGHWARDSAGSKGNRQHINSLIALDWNMVGTVTGQMDTCAALKIYKDLS